jgi:hypothetical protein
MTSKSASVATAHTYSKAKATNVKFANIPEGTAPDELNLGLCN